MKVLLIGLGGVGQRHARNLRTILGDRVELLAYRVRRLSHVIGPTLQANRSVDVEQELQIRSFVDLDAALAEKPQLAFVCNPTSEHVSSALACVRAGCDLFIEKPLSDSLDGVAELIRTVSETRRIAMVGYQMRFHPCVQALQSVLQSGSLGQLLGVRAIIGEYLPSWHPYEDYREGYAARASLGGGVVLTQIHEFDYLQALFGPIRSVYAIGGHWSHLDVDVEDVASTLMDGSATGRTLPIQVYQDYLQNPPVRQCEVFGDRGRALADFRALAVTVDGERGQPACRSFAGFDRNQMFIDEIRHLLSCIESRQKPMINLEEGARSLRIALAVKQSMRAGSVVHLETTATASSQQSVS